MISYYTLDTESFLNALANKEGSNSYSAVYPAGSSAENAKALGKYQFIPDEINYLSTINKLDIPSNKNFLNSPALQEQYVRLEIQDIVNFINANGLDQSIGKKITGVSNNITSEINVYGLIAGAHLGGKNGLKNFIWEGYDPHDALGTNISDYVSYFSGVLKKKVQPGSLSGSQLLFYTTLKKLQTDLKKITDELETKIKGLLE